MRPGYRRPPAGSEAKRPGARPLGSSGPQVLESAVVRSWGFLLETGLVGEIGETDARDKANLSIACVCDQRDGSEARTRGDGRERVMGA